MDEKERELEAVRRAEEEARHGAVRRDVGIGGSVSKSGGGTNVNLPVDDDAREALRSLRESVLVQLVGSMLILRCKPIAVDITADISALSPSLSIFPQKPSNLPAQMRMSRPMR